MNTKYISVILPNKEIEKLKAERDEYQRQAIAAEIKLEKMKLLMEGIPTSENKYTATMFCGEEVFVFKNVDEHQLTYLLKADKFLSTNKI